MAIPNLMVKIMAQDSTMKAFSSLKKSTRSASKSLKKVASAGKSAFGSLASAILSGKAALVGFVGALGLGALVKTTMNSVDALGKMARKLGISVEWLQAMKFAAEQSGMTVESFGTAIQFFSRGIAEARLGIGMGSKAFERLGIEVDTAGGMAKSAEVLFDEVADAISEMEDPAERTKVSMELFSRSGVDMINMLEGGSEGVSDLRGQFEALGITLSEDQVEATEAANDSMNKLWTVGKGIVSFFVTKMAPAIEEISESLAKDLAFAFQEPEKGMRILLLQFKVWALQLKDFVMPFIDGLFFDVSRGFINFTNNLIYQWNRTIGQVVGLLPYLSQPQLPSSYHVSGSTLQAMGELQSARQEAEAISQESARGRAERRENREILANKIVVETVPTALGNVIMATNR